MFNKVLAYLLAVSLAIGGIAYSQVIPIGGGVGGGGGGPVTNAGVFAVQEDGAALTALQLIDNFISGSRGLVTEDNSSDILTSLQLIDDANTTIGTTDLIRVAVFDAANTQITDFGGAVTNAGTFAVQEDGAVLTSLQLLDNIVSGAGAAITSIIPGTGATNLGKIEDTPAVTGDVGVGMLGVANNALAAKASSGDYTFLSLTSTGAALAVPVYDGAVVSSSRATHRVNAPGAGADVGIPPLGILDSVLSAVGASEGDYIRHRLTDQGALWVKGVGIDGVTYTEDVVSSSGDTGLGILGVRNTSRAILTSVTLDYSNFAVNAHGDIFSNPMFDINTASALQLGKREDDGHTTLDAGVMMLAVRRDSAGASTGANLDYSALQTNSFGGLYTAPVFPIITSAPVELIGIDETVDALGYAASVAATGGGETGEIVKVCLLASEAGTGTVFTPTGDLLVFDVDPTIAVNATTLTIGERIAIQGIMSFSAADWQSDPSGATNCQAVSEFFHNGSTTHLSWFVAAGETTWNSAAGDDEQLRVEIFYKRESTI